MAAACVVPTLSPRAVGCYQIEAPEWNQTHSEEFRFQLPQVISLDSALAADVPGKRRGWPWSDSLSITWDDTFPDWLRLPGDTIITPARGPAFHRMAKDSIVVTFVGRGGGFVALLMPQDGDYVGLAQYGRWRTGRRYSMPFALQRKSCS